MLHPAVGPADSHGEGVHADVEGLVLLQRLRHMEEHAPVFGGQLQMLIFLINGSAAFLIHLGQLRVVQIDPGVAVRGRIKGIAAVQGKLLLEVHALPGIILYLYGPLGSLQAHGRRADAAGRAAVLVAASHA